MQQQTRETGAECVMRRRRPAWPWTDATTPANESGRGALGTTTAAALAVRSAWRSLLRVRLTQRKLTLTVAAGTR